MAHPELQPTIERSERILVASHLAPDLDAVCSTLLLANLLEKNYPSKQITAFLEDKPYRVDELYGIDTITSRPLPEVLQVDKPDCIIVVDTNRYKRVTRVGEQAVKSYLTENDVLAINIDHHEPDNGDKFDITIRDPSKPAVTQMVYDIFFRQLGLNKPEGYGLTTMTGIVADSGTFTYGYDDYSDTFPIVLEIMQDGTTIGEAAKIIERVDQFQLSILSELARNTRIGDGYALSYIGDQTGEEWRKDNIEPSRIKAGCVRFANKFISNLDGQDWGVIIHPNASGKRREYYASFRASADVKDLSIVARALGGGGGHKSAAGVAFYAENVDDAIARVQEAIQSSES